MTNFAGNGNLSSLKSSCLREESFYLVFSGVNIFLAITATLGNILVLIALYKVSCIHPPTKLLLRCLAVTDLCVGLVVQPIFIASLLEIPSEVWNDLYGTATYLSWILSGVSILTTAAISVDRLLALLLGLRYSHTVTLRRVRVAIVCFLLTTISNGLIYSLYSPDIGSNVGFVVVLFSLFISVFSYTKVILRLRQHQAQIQQYAGHEKANGRKIPLNIERYKKMVHSVAWVQLAMVVCYFPAILIMIMMMTEWRDCNFFFQITARTTLLFNSSLNPFLYCWKICEVRQEVKNTMKEILCLQ
ncbi:melanocortin receptor 5-like [Acropora millepora]|uniref:melanocortin receptor 5-like n=1 Tax=Acropora millepora TaxID=45264 RepID=UPI001CF4A0CA|nr:melanocortin receptor 5-like [Acropora millepora]